MSFNDYVSIQIWRQRHCLDEEKRTSFYTLTSTCRRHAIDPQRYPTQLLKNLPVTPISQIEHWLPDDWKRGNPLPSP